MSSATTTTNALTATEAVAALQAAGYVLTVEDDDRIRARYAGEGTPHAATVQPLLLALRANKPAAVAFLRMCKTLLSLDPLQRLQHCNGSYPFTG